MRTLQVSSIADSIAALHTAGSNCLGRKDRKWPHKCYSQALDEMRMHRDFVWRHVICLFFFLLTVSWGSLSVAQSIQGLMLLSDQIEGALQHYTSQSLHSIMEVNQAHSDKSVDRLAYLERLLFSGFACYS